MRHRIMTQGEPRGTSQPTANSKNLSPVPDPEDFTTPGGPFLATFEIVGVDSATMLDEATSGHQTSVSQWT